METFLFRFVEPGTLPQPEPAQSEVDFTSAVIDTALGEGAQWEDFRIRESELAEHLRTLAAHAGLGRTELERLVLRSPPPGAGAPVTGFSFIPAQEAERLFRTLDGLDDTARDLIAEDDDLDAVYGLLLGAFEEAARRQMDVAVVNG